MENNEKNCCSPAQIANFFLTRARKEDVSISPMKLLKLVYIGYGWCLTILKRKLFNEEIEAWKFGPVIPSLYHEFKDFGPKPIERFAIEVDFDKESDEVKDIRVPIVEDNDVLQVLEKVWQVYKNHSAITLSNITHNSGSPWDKAWKNGAGWHDTLDDDEIVKRCEKKISELLSEN